jgi:hypothetical protein
MKTLYKIIIGFFTWLFMCVLIFLAIAFYCYELDPNLWTEVHRGIFGLLCIVSFITTISLILINPKSNEKA